MTRKKVKLAYIVNDSSRKATFKKRKRGLLKKVSELSTLCDIDACAIIYSPHESKPEVWPSHEGVQKVVAKLKKLPEIEQRKKMMNQETFLKQRLSKAREQLRKQQRVNRERELTCIMYASLTQGTSSLQGLSVVDVNDLGLLIDRNLKNIASRIKELSRRRRKSQQVEEVALMEEVEPVREEEEGGGHEWMMNMVNSNYDLGFDERMMMMMDTSLGVIGEGNMQCWETSFRVGDCHGQQQQYCDDEPLWFRPAFFT